MTFEPDPADLALSSIPGHETFDPRRHRFSEEELKPQPIMKKARKIQVPEEQKVSTAGCRIQAWLARYPQPQFLTVWPGLSLASALSLAYSQGSHLIGHGVQGGRVWGLGFMKMVSLWDTDSASPARPSCTHLVPLPPVSWTPAAQWGRLRARPRLVPKNDVS